MSTSTNYVAPQWQPETVLPVNGKLTNERQPRYLKAGRVAPLRAFKDEQTAYDSGMWLKAVLSREYSHAIDRQTESYLANIGLEIVNTGVEGSGSQGGYLVPAPMAATIIDVREKVGVTRRTARVLPTSGDSLSVPRQVGGLTVYYPGEASAITDSDQIFGQVAMNLRKRAVLSYLSSELVEDSIISVVDHTVSQMGYALALKEDSEYINGTGASSYGNVMGLLPSIGAGGVSTAATGNDTWPEITMADMVAFVGKLPDRYFAYGPSFICSHSFFNQVIARLAYGAGGTTLSEVVNGAVGGQRSFMGYPVHLSSAMPVATAAATNCALFGAFDQAAILADRGAPRVARSDDFKFSEDRIALRATVRYDINVFDAGTASAAGAYVALKTAS